MTTRHRLGVALLLDPPVATEVEGLRRALGDGSLGAVPPHVTLVPPVNVRASELDQAVEVLRRAAYAQRGPLELALGPVTTFWPDSPVVYLAVGSTEGDDRDRLGRLHDAVLSGPLRRPERWPWVPHVTLADDASPTRIESALAALGSYHAAARFDRVVLLEELDRCWSPRADACFGPPAVVGRGGLDLEITEGRVLGPDAVALARAAVVPDELGMDEPGPGGLVLTGRRHGRAAGVALAWADSRPGGPAQVCVLVSPGDRGQGVGRALLAALEARMREAGWSVQGAQAHGPAEFYSSCSAWARA